MKRYFVLVLLFTCLNIYAQQKSWTGVASYYAPKFNGRKTASGEIFSNSKMTCANNFLPLGTRIRVTNLKNGKSVEVKVNDRLHAKNKRLVDLSKAAAQKIGIVQSGLGKVKIEVIGKKMKIDEDEVQLEKNVENQ